VELWGHHTNAARSLSAVSIDGALSIDSGLSDEKPRVKITDGERLIFMMLRDMMKAMKLEGRGEIDAEFVASALFGGHYLES
jgi:hypothetical protein